MVKSVSRLVPKVPSVPGASRRQQYSLSTKRALIEVAEELFTEHGYANTSLDAIVGGARVTKGALYHHFSGKQALFEAVFEQVESDSSQDHRQGAEGQEGPVGEGAGGAARVPVGRPGAALPADRDPGGPRGAGLRAVPRAGGTLHVRHRGRHRPVRAQRRHLGPRRGDAADLRADLLRRDVLGRRVGGDRRRPDRRRGRVEAAIGFIIAGFQSLADAGVELPDLAPRPTS